MTLPGMRERTVRIGSAGKTFSLTGWKVGYVTARAEVMKSIAKTHQFMTFTTPPNLQWAAATGLGRTTATSRRWRARCNASATAWGSAGGYRLRGAAGHGTYFVTTDFRPLGFNGTTRISAVTSRRAPA